MNKKSGVFAAMSVVVFGFLGCTPMDGDYAPRRRPGFRPPSVPVSQEQQFPVDPLNAPPGYGSVDGGGQPGYSAVNPNSTTEPQPAPAPAPPPPPPPQPPAPKAEEPQYATKIAGKNGWIRSPYDGKVLDATGITPGTPVKDPETGRIMLVP
jgi:biotin carboxyl carrier protein